MVPEKGFVLGKPTPTIADFALYDLVIAGREGSLNYFGFDMTPYKKINRIVEMVGKLPGIKKENLTLTYFDG
jgi:hypothetical protein